MERVFERIAKFLAKKGWECDTSDPEHLGFFGEFSGMNGVQRCTGLLKRKTLTIFSSMPAIIPPEKHREAIVLANSMNTSLFLFGNLELDTETSLLIYRNGMYYGNTTLTPEVISEFILTTISIADEVFPLAKKVLAGEYTVDQAIASFGVGGAE